MFKKKKKTLHSKAHLKSDRVVIIDYVFRKGHWCKDDLANLGRDGSFGHNNLNWLILFISYFIMLFFSLLINYINHLIIFLLIKKDITLTVLILRKLKHQNILLL